MDNFIVSARKYRPVTFNTVVGQISITGTLKNAIRNNQLAQAFLFCGPRGVGKTTCARILAKTINCLHPTSDTEPCNECSSCIAFNDSASFNIHELDAASNNSVDDIRNLVDQVRIPPQMGKYKVYIIDEVHMLSPSAFNAFLKTLEEPPAYAKFILATTEKHKIIPTILSRCQIFDFKRITVDDIAKHLAFVADSEGVTADSEALHIIAHKADGALRDALSVFDQMVNLGDRNISRELVLENLNVLDYDYYFRIMNYMRNGNFRDTLLIVNEVIEKGFDGQHFITGMGEHLRNLLMSVDPATVKLIETSDAIRAKYKDQAQSVSLQLLVDSLDIINKCDVTYRTSNNKRLSLEVPLIQICRLSVQMQMPDVTQTPVIQSAVAENPKQTTAPASQQLVATEPVISEITKENIPAETTLQEQLKPVSEIETPKPTTVPEVVPENPAETVAEATKQVVPDNEINAEPVEEQEHDVPVQSHHISSISIKSVTKPDQLASSVKADLVKDRTGTYTFEQIEESLLRYAESKKADSALYFAALTSYKPVLQPDNVLLLTVGNTVLEKELNERRNKLLEFLRDDLKNDFITMQVKVTEELSETKKYMNDREKLDAMAAQNPNVNKLRDQLNLELDL
ncbi:MAG: DNA polymerase III subunit gamma/tau [Lentimicrobiaceae bacterium]|jgi:DNA polymerase-3 subunit gamma/tau